ELPLAADTVFVQNFDLVNHPNRERADDHGRLTLSALIPGATYHVEGLNTALSKEFKATARETIDLGDLTVEKPTRGTASAANRSTSLRRGESSIGETRARGHSTVHGHIAGSDGKPGAGVDVAVVAIRTAVGRGGDLQPRGVVLAEAKTDADAKYRIE